MSLELLGALLLSHMVADYPLQTDWMAANKHTDRDALVAHAAVHGACAFVAIAATVHVGLAAALSIPAAGIHAAVDSQDFSIRWDQTAHLVTAVVLAVVV